jgi:SAM-dependent methyltransferase
VNTVGTLNEPTRTAWLARVLGELPPHSRLLDAGAGERQYERFCPHLRYVAQDFAGYDGQGDGSGLQTGKWDQTRLDIVSDITAIPEPNESFVAILCSEVFEHLPNPLPAIKEFSRLLRPGGVLILTAPFCSLTHFAPLHFSTGFSRYFYETHLPAHGFRITELTPNGNFFEYLAQELRRVPSISDRYKTKGMRCSDLQAIESLLQCLGRLSSEDRGSSELLHFGYHVRAIRCANVA